MRSPSQIAGLCRAQIWDRRLMRFVLVGGVNTLFGYGVFFVLLQTGAAPASALAFATILGVLFNFRTTGRIVFDNGDPARLWRFAAGYAAIFVVDAALMEWMARLGIGAAWAQGLLAVPCVLLSYTINRALVFASGPENCQR